MSKPIELGSSLERRMKQHGVIFGYDRGYRYVDPGFEGTYWSTDILRTPLTKRLIVCVARWHWDGK